MTNNTFYSVIAFTSPKLNNNNNNYNSIVSSHYLTLPLEFPINSQKMSDKLDNVYTNKLKIIAIEDHTKDSKCYKIGHSFTNDYIIFSIVSSEFFSKEGIDTYLINNKNINHSIFMFRNLDYREIVTNLALFNIIISGGSNSKKHILSPIQLRLARFIIAINNSNGSEVANSFHFDRDTGKPQVDWTKKENKSLVSKLTEEQKKKFIENNYKENNENKLSNESKSSVESNTAFISTIQKR